MSTTIQVPDNIPISWLNRLQELNPDVLMLASEPNVETETQYMSKYFTFGQMEQKLSDDFKLGEISAAISDLYDNKASLSNYLTGEVKCDFSDPFIISSMTHVVSPDSKFGLSTVSGYRLSAGIQTVFTNAQSNNVQLKTLIPQLSSNTKSLSNPSYTYISSVTDENGHIKSLGIAALSSAIAANIGTATVQASPSCAISSVTTTSGKVTAVGSISITDVIRDYSAVYYKDFSQSDGLANDNFTDNDVHRLYIMKLKFNQLQSLIDSGQIRKDCIYMTVDNGELPATARIITNTAKYVVTNEDHNLVARES